MVLDGRRRQNPSGGKGCQHKRGAQSACQIYFTNRTLTGHGVSRLEAARQQASCTSRQGSSQLACQLFFTDYTLTGQRDASWPWMSDAGPVRRKGLSGWAGHVQSACRINSTSRTLSRNGASLAFRPKGSRRLALPRDGPLHLACPLSFTDYTLTVQPDAFPVAGFGQCPTIPQAALSNAFVRTVLAIFISPIALCLGAKRIANSFSPIAF